MGQEPGEIRQEIEETRGRMGDTVEALGAKTDVTGRAKASIGGKVDNVRSKITGATPDSGEVKQGARQAAGMAQENPLGLAIGAAAVGFVAGLMVPSTKIEDEKIGAIADQAKDQIKETGQEALDRGKQVAQEAAQSAKETAQESGQQQAQELKDSAQQSAQEVSPTG